MRKLILAALLSALSAFGAYTDTYKITIDHTKVGGTDLANYPVTLYTGNNATFTSVALTALHLVASGGAVTSASGFDIVPTSDQAGISKLPFERVFWGGTTGVTELHVLMTSVSSSVDTVFYLQVGNAAITTDQSNAGGTWNANYLAVYHYANGSSLSAADSTVNAVTGTITAATATTGQIDGGGSFNGTSAKIVSTNSGLYDTPVASFEAWASLTSLAPTQQGLFAMVDVGGAYRNFLGYDNSPSGMGIYNGTTGAVFPGSAPTTGVLHHFVLTMASSSSTLYEDGVPFTPLSIGNGTNSGKPFLVGTDGFSGLWGGKIDEVRLTNNILTAGWVLADYNSQKSGSTFFAAVIAPPPDFNCTGPTSGLISYTSTSFTCTKTTGTWGAGQTVTIADGTQGGTIAPSVGLPGVSTATTGNLNGLSSFTYTYKAVVVATISLSYTNNFAANNSFTSFYASGAVTLTFTGCPSSGSLLAASATCTVTLGGGAAFDGAHAVTICDAGNFGVFTPGIGGSGTSCVTVTPLSGTTFTFTYTPQSIGAKQFIVSNTSGWTNPANNFYAVTSPEVCSYSALATGNWNVASSWTPSGGCVHLFPRSGDTITNISGKHITCPAGIFCAVGSLPANNTTYDVTITPSGASGVLEVANTATLWLGGNLLYNAPAVSNPTIFAILQIDTGATVYHDTNNGSVAYHMAPATTFAQGNNLRIGTLGDTCTAATQSAPYSCPTAYTGINTATVNPILFDSAGTDDNITYQIYGSLVKNCGSATAPCVAVSSQGTSQSYALAGTVDIQKSIWDTTGNIAGGPNSMSATVTAINVKGNRFLDDLSGFFSLGPGSIALTKPCAIGGNYFSGPVGVFGNIPFGNCMVYGNAFPSGMFGFSVNFPLAMYQGNFAALGPDPNAAGIPLIANNYFYNQTPTSSWHGWSALGGNVLMKWNVYENMDQSAGTEAHCGRPVSTTGSNTYTLVGELSIRGGGGSNSCNLIGWEDQTSGSQAIGRVDHGGTNGHGTYAMIAFWGHPGSGIGIYPANQVLQTLRSNISWDSTTSAANYPMAHGPLTSTQLLSAPGGNINVAGIDYNNAWNMNTAATFTLAFGATNCAPSVLLATVYDTCNTSGTIGTHEKAVDPKYVDPTRNAAEWAAWKGYPQTYAGFVTAMQQCPDVAFCIQSLITYVKQGYQPTNLALKGAAHDGSIVGVTGSLGSGYTGTCGITFVPVDADDLGSGATATCTFVGGIPKILVTNPGTNYRVATPAAAPVTGTCTGGCVAASLHALVSPSDTGPVQIYLFAGS